ncbi:MAG: hypothetical protein DHS20C18_39820 [Saprospiraceae bacterium]|nr:MAG: hypothetical protein DHS20C18_39820 [Saprospiraceae bacterium]
MPSNAKNLYALIVGIDDYLAHVPITNRCKFGALGGCVNDATNVYNYLQAEPGFQLKAIFLKNDEATREAVLDAFHNHLGQAKEGDVALFYYSGHGIQEYADTNLWVEETDGKLESIVCYNEMGKTCLIADKELRYLIHRVAAGTDAVPKKKHPHVVTIFDCCHSGENTRNGYLFEKENTTRERRITCVANQRSWEGFTFHKEKDQQQMRTQPLSKTLPEGIHVHLAACESDESALEVNGAGVFTSHLLKILQRSKGDITYYDLLSQTRQYLRNSYSQKPKLFIPSDDSSYLYATFLNKENQGQPLYGNVVFTAGNGWTLDMGSLVGISPKTKTLTVRGGDDKTYTANIKRVGLDFTILEFKGEEPDREQSYKGEAEGVMAYQIRVHINNKEGDMSDIRDVMDAIQDRSENMVLEEDENKADYTLHVRNCYYYLTFPNQPCKPLIDPIDYCTEGANEAIVQYLQHISQWEYIRRLKNPYTYLFTNDSVKVEVFKGGKSGELLPINEHNEVDLGYYQRGDGAWRGAFSIKLTNTTKRKLYVSVLYLQRDFSVFLKLLSPEVYTLNEGESIWVRESKEGVIPYSLDAVVHDYNWPFVKEPLKLIISTEEFDVAKMEKKGLPDPLTLAVLRGQRKRGSLDIEDEEEPEMVGDDWTTKDIILKFVNPEYNRIEKSRLDEMMNSSQLAEYVQDIYLEPTVNEHMQPEYKPRPEIEVFEDAPSNQEKGALFQSAITLANKYSHSQRHRTYSSYLKRYPDRIRIVAEGDSWFQHPLLKDVIDHLMPYYNIYCTSTAGDTLRDYLQKGTFEKAIQQVNPRIFLLSGGGNDILGEGFQYFLNEALEGSSPEKFLNEKFQAELDSLMDIYETMFNHLKKMHPKMHTLVHGYDYVMPGDNPKKGWLGRYLIAKNIKSAKDRQCITNYILDGFNERLSKLVEPLDHVTYINLRGVVRDDQWHDEIHPTNAGYQDVAIQFMRAIDKLL